MSDKKKNWGGGGVHNLDNFFIIWIQNFILLHVITEMRDTIIQYKYICIETGWLTLKNS